MSALAMILTAAMVVPGDGSEKVSGETREVKLGLSGKWRGWYKASLAPYPIEPSFKAWDVVDEGAGRMQLRHRGLTYYGIYEQRGDRLMLCLGYAGDPRPTRFEGDDSQGLYILHRVKSNK